MEVANRVHDFMSTEELSQQAQALQVDKERWLVWDDSSNNEFRTIRRYSDALKMQRYVPSSLPKTGVSQDVKYLYRYPCKSS